MHRIRHDPFGAQLQINHLGILLHPRLRRRVRREVGAGYARFAEDRDDIDDDPGLPGDHARGGGLGEGHGAQQVCLDHFPGLPDVGFVLEIADAAETRVVDQDVDGAEFLLGLPDGAGGEGEVRHVAGDGDREMLGRVTAAVEAAVRDADLGGEGLEVLLRSRDTGDAGARGCECEGGGATDAATGAGDEDYFVLESAALFGGGDDGGGFCVGWDGVVGRMPLID